MVVVVVVVAKGRVHHWFRIRRGVLFDLGLADRTPGSGGVGLRKQTRDRNAEAGQRRL